MTEEKTSVTRDLVVYLLVRTDLPSMNSGKAMAQVHHAGVQMAANCKDSTLFMNYLEDGVKAGANSFNTTLSLGATLNDIETIFTRAMHNLPTINLEFGQVIDPSYPFVLDAEVADLLSSNPLVKFEKSLDGGKVLFTRHETTCAWFLGDRNDDNFRNLFSTLNLHP